MYWRSCAQLSTVASSAASSRWSHAAQGKTTTPAASFAAIVVPTRLSSLVRTTSDATGAPLCSMRTFHASAQLYNVVAASAGGTRLSVVRPDVAAEWAVDLNEDIDVQRVECGHRGSVWWRCANCGGKWTATVSERVESDQGCPSCEGRFRSEAEPTPQEKPTVEEVPIDERAPSTRSLAATHPQIAAMWHPTRNGSMRPEHVNDQSTDMVWWSVQEGTTEEVFQRRVLQFVLDPRSPSQKSADQVVTEETVIKHLADVSAAPFVPAIEPTHSWDDGDTATVLSHLHVVSRRHPRGEAPAAPTEDNGLFARQPIANVDDALRRKALSFFVHKIMDGKRGEIMPFSHLTEASITEAVAGPTSVVEGDQSETRSHHLPSFACGGSGDNDDEAARWKRYFSLAPEEASLAWNLRTATPPNEPHEQVVVEDSAPAAESVPQEQNASANWANDPAGKEEGLSASPARIDYPRKPKVFSPPEDLVDHQHLVPRRVSSRRRFGGGQATAPADAQLDEDGGRQFFGKYDEKFLDESEALGLYDATSNNDPIDVSEAINGGSLKDQQYNRRSDVKGNRNSNARRRPFQMKMPVDIDGELGASGASQRVVPPPQDVPQLPNAPRVVARSKKRRSPSDD